MDRSLADQPEVDLRPTLRGSCAECRHSTFGIQGMFQNAHLMCRAHPPRVQIIPGKGPAEFQLTALFPIIDRNSTCGEFEAPRSTAN